MNYTLGCRAGPVVKAAAPVAALMDAGVFGQCNSATPVPIFHIHGTRDSLPRSLAAGSTPEAWPGFPFGEH